VISAMRGIPNGSAGDLVMVMCSEDFKDHVQAVTDDYEPLRNDAKAMNEENGQ
jgi:hypothetical protein